MKRGKGKPVSQGCSVPQLRNPQLVQPRKQCLSVRSKRHKKRGVISDSRKPNPVSRPLAGKFPEQFA